MNKRICFSFCLYTGWLVSWRWTKATQRNVTRGEYTKITEASAQRLNRLIETWPNIRAAVYLLDGIITTVIELRRF